MIIANVKTKPHRLNILAEWLMNGNANDSSGNGYNLTAAGSPTLTSDRWGKASAAYAFDGVGGRMGTDAITNTLLGTAYTIHFHFLLSGSIVTTAYMFGLTHYTLTTDNENTSAAWVSTASTLYYDLRDNALNESILSTTVLAKNKWYTCAIVRNGNSVKFYWDNLLQLSDTKTIGTLTLNRLTIANYYNDTTDVYASYFKGNVDNVSINTVNLSAIELKLLKLYNK